MQKSNLKNTKSTKHPIYVQAVAAWLMVEGFTLSNLTKMAKIIQRKKLQKYPEKHA